MYIYITLSSSVITNLEFLRWFLSFALRILIDLNGIVPDRDSNVSRSADPQQLGGDYKCCLEWELQNGRIGKWPANYAAPWWHCQVESGSWFGWTGNFLKVHESLRNPDWLLVYYKTKAWSSRHTWQAVINITKHGRSGWLLEHVNNEIFIFCTLQI